MLCLLFSISWYLPCSTPSSMELEPNRSGTGLFKDVLEKTPNSKHRVFTTPRSLLLRHWWYKCITFARMSQFFFSNLLSYSEVKLIQSCPHLCNSMGCSLPGSSVHGILQSRILEWVAISFSRGSSWSRDWTQVSCSVSRLFTIRATRKSVLKYM